MRRLALTVLATAAILTSTFLTAIMARAQTDDRAPDAAELRQAR